MGPTRDDGAANTCVDFIAYPGAIGTQFLKDAAGGFPARKHETTRVRLREQPAGDFTQVFDDHQRRIAAGGYRGQMTDPRPPLRMVRTVRTQGGNDRVPPVCHGLRDASSQSIHLALTLPIIHQRQGIEGADGRRIPTVYLYDLSGGRVVQTAGEDEYGTVLRWR